MFFNWKFPSYSVNKYLTWSDLTQRDISVKIYLNMWLFL